MESEALVREFVERSLAPGLRLFPRPRGARWRAERACVAYLELADGTGGAPLRAFLDLEAFDPSRRRPGLGIARTLPVELGLQLGRVAVRVAELRSLACGDVVVCEEGEAFGWRGVVEGAGREIVLVEREGTLVVQGRIPRQTMEDTRMQKSPDGLSSIDDARVEVALEAARIVTTLAELESLSVGSVLVSSRSVSRLVTLRVGGQPIARGELVDVDGQLGVRITELASADAAQ